MKVRLLYVMSGCSVLVERSESERMTHGAAAAFETAWCLLQALGHPLADEKFASATREKLAKRIFATARRGEHDPLRLMDDALWFVSKDTGDAVQSSKTAAHAAELVNRKAAIR